MRRKGLSGIMCARQTMMKFNSELSRNVAWLVMSRVKVGRVLVGEGRGGFDRKTICEFGWATKLKLW